ncbi:hypothetical protein [Embleya hyalina]|uniref:hypothetical protein n=1 Tax=Embleya hyalina TaxID=516124 RepID=UPI00135AFB9E|nr:hypothetical protein [Embleya hyalina]
MVRNRRSQRVAALAVSAGVLVGVQMGAAALVTAAPVAEPAFDNGSERLNVRPGDTETVTVKAPKGDTATFTFDKALTGVTIKPSSTCSGSGLVYTCAANTLGLDSELWNFALTAAAGVTVPQNVNLTVTDKTGKTLKGTVSVNHRSQLEPLAQSLVYVNTQTGVVQDGGIPFKVTNLGKDPSPAKLKITAVSNVRFTGPSTGDGTCDVQPTVVQCTFGAIAGTTGQAAFKVPAVFSGKAQDLELEVSGPNWQQDPSRATARAHYTSDVQAPPTTSPTATPTGTGSPTPTSTATPTTSDDPTASESVIPISQGDDGSELAETGGGGNELPLILSGVALLAIGVAAALYARRRRGIDGI